MTDLLVRLFIKNYKNTDEPSVRHRYGTFGSFIGIIINLSLSAFKITVGFIGGSISIIADGFNNLSDIGSSVITMIGFKLANKPADKDHPFGHGRIEYMSAFIVAVTIMLVGFELLKSSVTSIINNTPLPEFSIFAIIILIISVLLKFWLFLFFKKLGKKINSDSFIATSKDSLNDVIATSVILISVLASRFFQIPFNIDAVMGILVALFILYSGITSAKDTINHILGTPPDKKLISDIENTVLSFEYFTGIHDLIVHNYGPGRKFASVHVEVPISCDIVKCHEQVDLCEKLLFEKFNISVVIHTDPMDTDNEYSNEIKEKLDKKLKEIHKDLSLHDFHLKAISDDKTNLVFDVTIPSNLKLSEDELEKRINEMAKEIDSSFSCLITFDSDFLGKY